MLSPNVKFLARALKRLQLPDGTSGGIHYRYNARHRDQCNFGIITHIITHFPVAFENFWRLFFTEFSFFLDVEKNHFPERKTLDANKAKCSQN
jgi:hypothetical protein